MKTFKDATNMAIAEPLSTTTTQKPKSPINPEFNPINLIEKKKHGIAHSQAEIQDLVRGVMAGTVPDYQLAAWLMAVCLKGLTEDETFYLTEAFVNSGEILAVEGIEGIFVDKHSTGGVGDKTTLIVVPLLAAMGLKIAKLSGRGLGFTGGTIDKLEAIPGFKVSQTTQAMRSQLQQVGAVLSSQTGDLAPADALFYALRDVTATVDNLSLIAASVVSKKIASGADVIVLDIKVGRGAFMKTLTEAKALASLCRTIGARFGKRLETVISTMDQPLGSAIGHTVEILEVVETLQGKGQADLEYLCLALASVACVSAGLFPTTETAWVALKEKLNNGEALRKFEAIVKAQGGEVEALDAESATMPQPARMATIMAPISGYIHQIDSLKIAKAVKMLGGGRSKKEDVLDLGVGVQLQHKVGDFVEVGEVVARVLTGKHHFNEALETLKSAFQFCEMPVDVMPDLILESSLPLFSHHEEDGQ
jgi:pyrimidine-nucleoside phosphorylase